MHIWPGWPENHTCCCAADWMHVTPEYEAGQEAGRFAGAYEWTKRHTGMGEIDAVHVGVLEDVLVEELVTDAVGVLDHVSVEDEVTEVVVELVAEDVYEDVGAEETVDVDELALV